MIKRLLAAVAAFALTFTLAAPAAQARDTYSCITTGGVYCGKVVNSSASVRYITVRNHDNVTVRLDPGRGSRQTGSYLRDVSSVYVPYGYRLSYNFVGYVRWLSGCGGGYWSAHNTFQDNVESYTVTVYRC